MQNSISRVAAVIHGEMPDRAPLADYPDVETNMLVLVCDRDPECAREIAEVEDCPTLFSAFSAASCENQRSCFSCSPQANHSFPAQSGEKTARLTAHRCHPHLFMAGGIDVSQLLPFGSPAEVSDAVKRAIDAAEGRIMMGSSTELNDSVPLPCAKPSWHAPGDNRRRTQRCPPRR